MLPTALALWAPNSMIGTALHTSVTSPVKTVRIESPATKY